MILFTRLLLRRFNNTDSDKKYNEKIFTTSHKFKFFARFYSIFLIGISMRERDCRSILLSKKHEKYIIKEIRTKPDFEIRSV
jgi:hypothetical protein